MSSAQPPASAARSAADDEAFVRRHHPGAVTKHGQNGVYGWSQVYDAWDGRPIGLKASSTDAAWAVAARELRKTVGEAGMIEVVRVDDDPFGRGERTVFYRDYRINEGKDVFYLWVCHWRRMHPDIPLPRYAKAPPHRPSHSHTRRGRWGRRVSDL